jgi:hypothetical protein
MVRYNILALYLLSDVPPDKYQVKFGTVALRTCLTSYLNLSRSLHEDYNNSQKGTTIDDSFTKEIRTQDEIMSYVALFHMTAVLRSEEGALPPPSASSASLLLMEESGSGWGALFSTFTKYGRARSGSMLEMYPRWEWVLEVAASMQSGNYQHCFNLLERGPKYQQSDVAAVSDNARFLILARCCCSSALNLIRLSVLRQYNHSFGKAEKVPVQNLARLLRLGHDKVVAICRNASLPIIDDENGDPSKIYVAMKSAPIEVSGEESILRMCNPGRSSDLFVFGTEFKDDVASLANKLHAVHVDESADDWEERDCNIAPLNVEPSESGLTVGRVDYDHVMIPLSMVLSKLVQ